MANSNSSNGELLCLHTILGVLGWFWRYGARYAWAIPCTSGNMKSRSFMNGMGGLVHIYSVNPSKDSLQCSKVTSVHICIGASDRILDHCLSRNSEPTILVNLVPIGSPALLISTQALSSNRTTIPSFLCNFFAVRTTIACRMSPLRTLFAAAALIAPAPPGPAPSPKLRCFWTTTMMRSPILACLFMRRLATHSTIEAPELSMQLSIVLSWIISDDSCH